MWTNTFTDPPQVKIVLGAQIDPGSIREGTDVYFECIVESNPWIREVSWFHEGRTLYSDPSSGIIISNQSLVLQRVKRSSRGKYSCAALNQRGQGRSSDFLLRVLCKYQFLDTFIFYYFSFLILLFFDTFHTFCTPIITSLEFFPSF